MTRNTSLYVENQHSVQRLSDLCPTFQRIGNSHYSRNLNYNRNINTICKNASIRKSSYSCPQYRNLTQHLTNCSCKSNQTQIIRKMTCRLISCSCKTETCKSICMLSFPVLIQKMTAIVLIYILSSAETKTINHWNVMSVDNYTLNGQ